jgi:hypothetical protein
VRILSAAPLEILALTCGYIAIDRAIYHSALAPDKNK